MSRFVSVTSRRTGRLLAGAGSALTLGLAVYTAIAESVPELRLYDGFWMLAGAALAVGAVGPLVWRWPRERALLALGGAVALAAWVPLVVLALQARIPVPARLQGAIFFSSADIIGVALPVGAALAWLALRDYRTPSDPPAP